MNIEVFIINMEFYLENFCFYQQIKPHCGIYFTENTEVWPSTQLLETTTYPQSPQRVNICDLVTYTPEISQKNEIRGWGEEHVYQYTGEAIQQNVHSYL